MNELIQFINGHPDHPYWHKTSRCNMRAAYGAFQYDLDEWIQNGDQLIDEFLLISSQC